MAYEIYRNIREWFWDDDIWLPKNITWDDLQPNKQNNYANYAKFHDLYVPIGLAFILIAIRFVLERYAFTPFGIYNGLKPSKQKQVTDNPVLEKAFAANGIIGHKQVQGLAKQTDLSERQIERWFRQRNRRHRPTRLVKFSETCWRFLYYTTAFLYGLWTLWDKKWFWNIKECWYDYPRHHMTNDMWWYYMFSLSFYWSVTFTQFLDVKRKDFWQMFLHHITTIMLLSFSWTCNLVRIGSLVLVVHDCADIFLESAKMANYIKSQALCDILFVIFITVWTITRLIVYPFWILYSCVISGPGILLKFSPAARFLNGLLLLLLVLHLKWTYAIARIAVTRIIASTQKDVRSSSSSSEADGSSETKEKTATMPNGTDSH